LIYFDNAATSNPKPPAVLEAIATCVRERGGNPGRGAHRLSLAAAETVYTCREAACTLLGAAAPEQIVFMPSATYALNAALWGLVHEGDHVLYSELEHNAVMRPLYALRAARHISLERFRVIGLDDEAILQDIAHRIRPDTRLLVCVHASNVCSVYLPLARIGALCRAHGITFVVDAAQSAGHLPIDMAAMQIDALALPAHKGLLGIQGCGVLALAPHVMPAPLVQGGSGYDSRAHAMPPSLPERLEAGTLPTPAIAGLLSGIGFVRSLGLDEIQSRVKTLFLAARERLETLGGIQIYQATHAGAVLLFSHSTRSATSLARSLDKAGIAVRGGLHCAPLAHAALGTPEGGAVRVSFGPFNTLQEVDALWQALKA